MTEVTPLDFNKLRDDEMRQWAIDNPGRMHEVDCWGRTVLLAAVRMGRAAIVAWLIDEQGVSIYGHCPLSKHLLHFTRSVDVMAVLLARGANPLVVIEDGLTVLMWQALHGNAGCVEILLQDPQVKAIVNAMTHKRGMNLTALHLVCECLDINLHERRRITELLLEAGADPNLPCRPGDPTSTAMNLLTYGHAVPPSYEHPDYCILSEADLRRWVVDNPGQVNKLDRKGYTLLRVAIKKGFNNVVEWLLNSYDISVHHHVIPPHNLLHLIKTPDIMSIVLSRGVDPTVIVGSSLTLLMWHAKVGHAECVKILLGDSRVRRIINATAETELGRSTALHFVCGAKDMDHSVRVELVRSLLEHGADPNFGYPSAIYSMPDYHRQAGRAGEPLYPHVGIIKGLLTDHQQIHACTDFYAMSEAQLQDWIMKHPERLHTRGKSGATILRVATEKGYSALARWLIIKKEIGKDGHVAPPKTLLHIARTADIMRALLHLSFDLTALYVDGKTILMWHAVFGSVECVEALLQDRRVLATINATARHDKGDLNALQMVCETNRRNDAHRSRIIQLLIRAGADINVAPSAVSLLPIPCVSTASGHQFNKELPHEAQNIHQLSLASLIHAWEERGYALVIKARRIIEIHRSIKNKAPGEWASKDLKMRESLVAMPTFMKSRLDKEQVVPEVALMRPGDEKGRLVRRAAPFS